jgi:hypothetical protein
MSASKRPTLEDLAIPRATKGAAVPVPALPQEAPRVLLEHDGGGEGTTRADAPEALYEPHNPTSRARGGEGARAAAPDPAPIEPRITVSVRLPASLQERLRQAAFHARREKQAIVEEALDRYLRHLGF